MNKTSGRWIIIFITAALLALVYAHLIGRHSYQWNYAVLCRPLTNGEVWVMCHLWRSQAVAQMVAVVMLAAAAWVYNERRV